MSLDLSHTEFDEMLKNAALDFMRRDATKLVIQDLLNTDTGCNADLWKKAVGMDWMGVIIPEEYGGTGNSLTSAGVIFEVMGTGPLPGPYFSSAILGSLIVLEAGSKEQKQTILPEVAGGGTVLSLALTEPEYSWEPGVISTSAESSDGDFVINGMKLFTFDAKAATHFIVAARTGKEDDPEKAVSLFLVAGNTHGVSVRRLAGFLSGQVFEVKLDSVKVPRSALIGKINEGWAPLKAAIGKAIPVLCAYKVGGCQAVFDMALEYSRDRIQFGRPIGRFQRVQDMIIQMVNHADSARWTTYEALWKLDTGKPALESIHLAKAVTSEAYWQICTLGHRVFSGISYSKEHSLSFHTRTSRHLYNFLGDPAYHRQKIAQLLVP
jgi:alkylation response protein AidB-like acyl-CoA dehydrogenase